MADSLSAGRNFGIRYLVDGSLDETESGIVVRCRLVETATGRQVWQERFTERSRRHPATLRDDHIVDRRCHRTAAASGGSRARLATRYLGSRRIRLLSARAAGLLFPNACRQQRGDRAAGDGAQTRSAFRGSDGPAWTLRGDQRVAGYRVRFRERRRARALALARAALNIDRSDPQVLALCGHLPGGGRRRTCRRWRAARSRPADESQQRRSVAARRLGFRMER